MEAADIAVRFLQFGTLLPLFGMTAFAAYAPNAARLRRGWGMPTLIVAAIIASVASLHVLAARLTGAASEAFNPETLWLVISGTAVGVAWAVRVATLLLALFLPRLRFILSALAVATLPWGGHGAASTGAFGVVHLIADIIHLLAAGIWTGALIAFVILALDFPNRSALHGALQDFGGVGSAVVAALIGTGLINTAAVGGWPPLESLASTWWGWLLISKLALVLAMLALAARHRFWLVPSLANERDYKILARSLAWETALAVSVVALVSLMGTISPTATG